MTSWMLLTLALAAAGQIAYHIGQRAVPRGAPPLIVLAGAYFVAGTLCIVAAWFAGAFADGVKLRAALGWPTWVIALSIVAIELGYLTAYRSGWTIGTAFATASASTVFGLALVDRLLLGNYLTVRQLVGLALSMAAVWLLAAGPRASA